MSGNGKVPDAIDAAIAATEAPTIAMRQQQVMIASTGRPAAILVPADVTDDELVELASWVAMGFRFQLRAEREKGAASRLVTPSGIRLVPPA